MTTQASQKQWVCYGMGVDSTAMLVGMVRAKEPIDLITFADTGGELPHTYAYREAMDEYLRKHDYPGITVVKVESTTLEEACLKNETVPSLAFGWHTCSIRFKIAPQVKYANRYFSDVFNVGEKVVRCIGYDAGLRDKKRSARSTTKFPDLKQYDNRFPLQEWGWTREQCVEEILKEGLPDPGKSSCFFCPARKRHEIDELAAKYPEYLERALKMEKIAINSGKLKTTKGIGRSFSWTEYLNERPG